TAGDSLQKFTHAPFRDKCSISRYNEHRNIIPFQLEESMPVEVFISYAHKDRKLRDELAVHLGNLRNQHLISDWYDGDLIPGTEWQPDILHHLRTARIILLLISAHFMASPFCWDIEMNEALAGHEVGQARVIPILLRPTDWQDASLSGWRPTAAGC